MPTKKQKSEAYIPRREREAERMSKRMQAIRNSPVFDPKHFKKKNKMTRTGFLYVLRLAVDLFEEEETGPKTPVTFNGWLKRFEQSARTPRLSRSQIVKVVFRPRLNLGK